MHNEQNQLASTFIKRKISDICCFNVDHLIIERMNEMQLHDVSIAN